MKKILFCVSFTLFVSGAAAVAQVADPYDRLKSEIEKLVQSNPNLDNAFWGIAIQSLESGKYIYLENNNKGLVPASNQKLFTTAVALEKLGPDFQYHTDVILSGFFENDSTFVGDVILRGSGDPSISGRFNDGRITETLEAWADSIRAKGISIIEGNIVGDDNVFADEPLGNGWEVSEEPYWYSAQISGLSLNDNCIDISVSPAAKAGDPAIYEITPNTGYVNVTNNIETVAKGTATVPIDFDRKRGTNEITLTGSIAVQSAPYRSWITINNPTLFTATVFREILGGKGVAVAGKAVDIDDLEDYRYAQPVAPDSIPNLTKKPDCDTLPAPGDTLLQSGIRCSYPVARFTSLKLGTLIEIVNKNSQNFYAEQIFRTVGRLIDSSGSSDHAARVEREFLKEKVLLNVDKIVISDGSGLSRLNQVSPSDIINLLKHMHRHAHADAFKASLAVAGVDGSLKYRMVGTAAAGNVKAKTGYIDRVRTLSGYVTTQDGEELVFSLMCNGFTVPKHEVEKIQDTICKLLAEFSAGKK